MIYSALLFLSLAMLAAVFGFTGIESTSDDVARVLCLLFAVLSLWSFLRRSRSGSGR